MASITVKMIAQALPPVSFTKIRLMHCIKWQLSVIDIKLLGLIVYLTHF